MRKEFEEGAIKSDKLLSYKNNKFFNDDDMHASASITVNYLNGGKQRTVYELIKQDGVWKITRDKIPSSTNGSIKENLNNINNRPSKAMIYEVQENVRKGNVGIAQPSTQPT
jgi:hypothetical protein